MIRGRNCEQVVDLNGDICGRWVPSFATHCLSCGSVKSTRAERVRLGGIIAARMLRYFETTNQGGDIMCRSKHVAAKTRAARRAASIT